MAERRISHNTLYVLFERLNRSGDLNPILQAIEERRQVLEKQVHTGLSQVDIANRQALRDFDQLQGRMLEAARFLNAFKHWGQRRQYDGDGSETTKERVPS